MTASTNLSAQPLRTALAANDVRVRLSGKVVIERVSLELPPGEVVAVAGPNGAGKSTLLRALCGLVKPEAGRVEVAGMDLAALEPRALGRMIAYLPQERTVHWPMSVESVVGLGRLPHRGPAAGASAADREAVAAAMRAMDVEAFRGRSIGELSGGEKARVLMARALAQGATFLVADEPTSGLDPAHALALFSHVRRLAAEGRGVILALHDLSLAVRFADRVVLLKAGRLVAAGTPRDVVTEANLAAVYGVRSAIGEIGGLPVVLAREPLT